MARVSLMLRPDVRAREPVQPHLVPPGPRQYHAAGTGTPESCLRTTLREPVQPHVVATYHGFYQVMLLLVQARETVDLRPRTLDPRP
eukprot:1911993-Rhodomonas_salina.1